MMISMMKVLKYIVLKSLNPANNDLIHILEPEGPIQMDIDKNKEERQTMKMVMNLCQINPTDIGWNEKK